MREQIQSHIMFSQIKVALNKKPSTILKKLRKFLTCLSALKAKIGVTGDPRMRNFRAIDIFRRKFTSRSEEPLGTYSYHISPRSVRIQSR